MGAWSPWSATIIDATSGHTCSSDPEPNTRPPVASWSNHATEPNQKKKTRNGSPVVGTRRR